MQRKPLLSLLLHQLLRASRRLRSWLRAMQSECPHCLCACVGVTCEVCCGSSHESAVVSPAVSFAAQTRRAVAAQADSVHGPSAPLSRHSFG